MDRLHRVPLGFIRWGLILLAFVVCLTTAARQRLEVPSNDAVEYITYAQSLFLRGEYARDPQGPQADSRPGREPLYPLLIAGTAHLSPSLAQSLTTCSPPRDGCHDGYRSLIFLNGILLALTVGFAVLTVQALGGRHLPMLITGLYLILNLHICKDMKYVLSDFLAMAMMGLTTWTLVLAVRRGRAVHWLLAAVALAGLTMTKGIFMPLAAMLTVGAGLYGLWRLRQGGGVRALLPVLLLAGITLGLNGAWMARNAAIFGAGTDGRGATVLSTREVFNHMTAQEHMAAFLWWTKGPGDDWAKKLFPVAVWERHEWYAENGFYNQGQVVRQAKRLAALQAEHPDWTQAQVESRVAGVVIREILAEWPSYLLTMPVMIYRGLWTDEFIVIGFPLLIIVSLRAVRRRRWDVAMALLPGWWSIILYAALSLNTPRYQMTALIALAVGAGMFAAGKAWWQDQTPR